MHLDHGHDHLGAVSADAHRPDGTRRALRIGLGGPVGSGKTATVAALCRILRDTFSLAVVTNDIYTREDAEFLLRNAVLPPERIQAVETGACPHTAIRDDISANLEAVEELEDTVGPLDLILVESGGDNLTATFSKGLVDAQIFVIDVAAWRRHPAQGRPRRHHRRPPRRQQDRPRPLRGLRPGADGARRRGAARRTARRLHLAARRERRRPRRRLGPGPARGMDRVSLRATARIVADADGGLPLLVSDGPLALRRTRASGPYTRVTVVGAMSAPLGGDRLAVETEVRDGARLLVDSAAATLALPGRSADPAAYDVRITVGEEGVLRWLPEQLVSVHGSDLRMRTVVELAATARLVLREEQILGRHGEPPGTLVTRLTVRRAGRPSSTRSWRSVPARPAAGTAARSSEATGPPGSSSSSTRRSRRSRWSPGCSASTPPSPRSRDPRRS